MCGEGFELGMAVGCQRCKALVSVVMICEWGLCLLVANQHISGLSVILRPSWLSFHALHSHSEKDPRSI